ncbi:aspartic proteinase Asp1-like protein [Tanacetum coccineum]
MWRFVGCLYRALLQIANLRPSHENRHILYVISGIGWIHPLHILFDFDMGSFHFAILCEGTLPELPSCSYIPPYKTVSRNLVGCTNPICDEIRYPKDHKCESIDEPCTYYIRYADGGSSLGVVINDQFLLTYTNGTLIRPHIYWDVWIPPKTSAHPEIDQHVDGVLVLARAKEGITARTWINKKRSGSLFQCGIMGLDWCLPIIYVGRYTTGIRNLRILFDNAATHTYFASEAYATLVSMIKKDVKEKKLEEVYDEHLPLCWKGPHPFESIEEVIHKFRPIALSFFENPRNAIVRDGP